MSQTRTHTILSLPFPSHPLSPPSCQFPCRVFPPNNSQPASVDNGKKTPLLAASTPRCLSFSLRLPSPPHYTSTCTHTHTHRVTLCARFTHDFPLSSFLHRPSPEYHIFSATCRQQQPPPLPYCPLLSGITIFSSFVPSFLFSPTDVQHLRPLLALSPALTPHPAPPPPLPPHTQTPPPPIPLREPKHMYKQPPPTP